MVLKDDSVTVFGEEYAGVYDCLYQDKNYGRECDFVESVLSEYAVKVKSILDLGCGTGGHSLILSERGYEVVGVDNSKQMLNIARKKAGDRNLLVKFIDSDIRNLNLQIKYDVVISMFAVMSYQITNEDISKQQGTIWLRVVCFFSIAGMVRQFLPRGLRCESKR
jgi:ubiquinone/menaquinone biosynthesis C-methylase UbiE